ncbi:uncharacterized protein [Miscanthus floridulus]|uniref:uncharacterized protein n=1 Tax=Miscanthus floridulus TaxID=154761 RepID=UPI003458EB95
MGELATLGHMRARGRGQAPACGAGRAAAGGARRGEGRRRAALAAARWHLPSSTRRRWRAGMGELATLGHTRARGRGLAGAGAGVGAQRGEGLRCAASTAAQWQAGAGAAAGAAHWEGRATRGVGAGRRWRTAAWGGVGQELRAWGLSVCGLDFPAKFA